ncbi:uncharacterized protein rab11fip5a isoform X2 [Corythoichthys intestinalis]|uniref:uncharacterized protein rab11fip5a isoform X2 n=1 Tax=Corythoichthys intestinalis TaxID=161448 RepID=UPI0025A57FB5|nr:uncharacterized protein rab11fip5a isoform X2 [Corythoichthys intestinalis]
MQNKLVMTSFECQCIDFDGNDAPTNMAAQMYCRWYRLNSKTGKKEKERGDIQVSVQFTRNNLTASMYDLVMKDKGGASTFSKLKERMRGKRRSGEDDGAPPSPPGGAGPLRPARRRLPSDGGGEEDYEDDEGGELRRSKMRTFFLRGKLRKSADTRSSTSLGSESSESSSRGGSLSPTAGISVVVSDLSDSPSNSSNLTADSPEHTEDTSPKLSPSRCDLSEEMKEITVAVPQLHVGVAQTDEPPHQSGISAGPGASLAPRKTLPLSASLQNLRPRACADPLHGTVGDGRRWSFDEAGEEESAAIAAAMEKNCPVLSTKPRLVAPPKLDPRIDSPFSPSHHSNPFCPSPPSNPFFSHDPFSDSPHDPFHDTAPPPLPFLSSARPPIEELFPKAAHPLSQTGDCPTTEDFSNNAVRAVPTASLGSEKSSNPFTSAEEPEWDASFEEFAACRLQGPKDQTSGILGVDQRDCSSNEGPKDQTSGSLGVHPSGRSNDEGTDSPNLKRFSLSSYTMNSLDPIPEEASSEYCSEVFSTSSESYPNPEWHQVDSSPNMPPCYPDSVASSGVGTSVEDDFLSCISSYSASDKFSACSPDKTEPQSVPSGSEMLTETAVSPKGFSSTDEFSNEDQQSEDSEWWDSEGSLVFTPPPTMSTAVTTGLEAADPDLQPKIFWFSDDNIHGGPQCESSGQGCLCIRTSSPSTACSSGVKDSCWESHGDLDQSGSSEYYQSCHSLPPLECSGVSQSSEKLQPEDSTIPVEAVVASINPAGSTLFYPKPENGPDTNETDFTVSQVPPETDSFPKPVEGSQFTVLNDMLEAPPSQLPDTTLCARSFQQNIDDNLQFYQNQFEISQPIETLASENSTVFGERGTILESTSGSVNLDRSIDDPNNHTDLLSPVTDDRSDTLQPGFASGDEKTAEIFPVSASDWYKESIISDQKDLPPELPKTSLSTRNLLQSLDSNLDYHQSSFGVSDPNEKIHLENSTFCGELAEIPEPASMSPVVSTSEPKNQAELFLAEGSRSDTFDFGFVAGDNGSSEVLTVTPTDLSPKAIDGSPVTVLDGIKLSPDLSQRTSSLVRNLDGNSQDCLSVSRPEKTFCGELGDILNTVSASTISEGASNDPKPPDWLSLVTEDQPAHHRSGLTAWEDESSKGLPATPLNSYPNPVGRDQFTAFDDVFPKSPLPQLPEISQRTSNLLQNFDGNSQGSFSESEPAAIPVPENWTFCGELGDTFSTVSAPAGGSSDDPKPPDRLSLVTKDFLDRPESGFTAWDDGSSGVFPDSDPNPVKCDQFTTLDDVFAKRPPSRCVPSHLSYPNDQTVSQSAERRGSENSAFFGELAEISQVTCEGSASGPYLNAHIPDWLTEVMEDHGSSQVLDQDPFNTKPPLQRTQSETTLASDIDKTLPLSFWNESWAFPAVPARPPSPSLSIASAPPLTCQGSWFSSSPSPLFPLADASQLPSLNLQEVHQQRTIHQELSPHPVRPLSSGPSVLEKIKSSLQPGKSGHTSDKILTEGAGSYYHLSHSELVSLVVRREAELERQKAQFERQRALLAKREVELRKLKPQVRDLEDYIDTLLVRIMEQKPTLLQIRSRLK